ncbi:MAG: glycosyltransferase family 2 protein [Solirubrobacterales bacterium]
MRLVLALLTHNEADILETTLRYHFDQGIDHVVAYDDQSTDGTCRLLRDGERAGKVTVLPRLPGTYLTDGARWRTRLLRHAASELRPDWILGSDPDEFWWPLGGDLKDAFARVPEAAEYVIAPRTDFVYTEPVTPGRAVEEQVLRESVSTLAPKVAVRPFPDLVAAGGFHRVARSGTLERLDKLETGEPLRASGVLPARLFHYAVRSQAQFEWVGTEKERPDPKPPARRRDAVYRTFVESGWQGDELDLGAPWRQEAIRRGLQEGVFVVDRRVARFLADGHIGDGKQTAADVTEANQQVIENLARKETSLRSRTHRLHQDIESEREANRRWVGRGAGRLAGALRLRIR